MQGLEIWLSHLLDGNQAPSRPRHGFTDRFGITRIIFMRFYGGFHQLGRAQLRRMPNGIYKAASSRSELDDESSSSATSLQPSVGITGSRRWVGVGYAECDGSRLHGLPEAVKFFELAVVRAHRGRRELDATLWLACETTYVPT
jgi:hypothetical protein